MLLARLSPVFPFNMLNHALGLTKVTIRSYAPASWAGMLPGTLMYVYLGAAPSKLATADRDRSTLEWCFYGDGLVATIPMTVYVTRPPARVRVRAGTARRWSCWRSRRRC